MAAWMVMVMEWMKGTDNFYEFCVVLEKNLTTTSERAFVEVMLNLTPDAICRAVLAVEG